MPDLCQACRTRPVEITHEYDEAATPYRLCGPCYGRLRDAALRPLEFFNLAAIHGPTHELHDDFYDDNGEACAPEDEVEHDPALAFPSLASLSGQLPRLVDYVVVKWWYPREVTPYLQTFAPAQVLQALDEKLALNPQLLPDCLEIAAEALGPAAAAWVRYQLAQHQGPDNTLFAQALASCLPPAEAEASILEMLSVLGERELRERILYLRFFAGDGPLDWLEARADRISTVSDHYGTVCAGLGMTWPRVQRWLQHGRPLSLMALDALVQCSTGTATLNRAPWLRENPPRLHAPTATEEMNRVLAAYLARDGVPRTKNAVGFVQQHWPQILKQ